MSHRSLSALPSETFERAAKIVLEEIGEPDTVPDAELIRLVKIAAISKAAVERAFNERLDPRTGQLLPIAR